MNDFIYHLYDFELILELEIDKNKNLGYHFECQNLKVENLLWKLAALESKIAKVFHIYAEAELWKLADPNIKGFENRIILLTHNDLKLAKIIFPDHGVDKKSYLNMKFQQKIDAALLRIWPKTSCFEKRLTG